ncbi:FAD-dependent monooxygenase [Sphaerisporangium sp. NPDC051011]|uniref:FAD-dependent monooxygenase n=1 Tax=Sphaerisporangium sp. NPDC051011 TaxID=3155792 RepID=UPI0033DF89A3
MPNLQNATRDDEVFDVVVIGYGPVGQSMAALLGQRGRSVAVIERWPGLYGREGFSERAATRSPAISHRRGGWTGGPADSTT